MYYIHSDIYHNVKYGFLINYLIRNESLSVYFTSLNLSLDSESQVLSSLPRHSISFDCSFGSEHYVVDLSLWGLYYIPVALVALLYIFSFQASLFLDFYKVYFLDWKLIKKYYFYIGFLVSPLPHSLTLPFSPLSLSLSPLSLSLSLPLSLSLSLSPSLFLLSLPLFLHDVHTIIVMFLRVCSTLFTVVTHFASDTKCVLCDMYEEKTLSTFFISIAEFPPRFLEEPQSAFVKSHSSHVIRCRTTPGASLSWTHNSAPVTGDYASSRSITMQGETLTIAVFKQKPRDQATVGVYNCIATNGVGTVVSRDAILSKAGKNKRTSNSEASILKSLERFADLVPVFAWLVIMTMVMLPYVYDSTTTISTQEAFLKPFASELIKNPDEISPHYWWC